MNALAAKCWAVILLLTVAPQLNAQGTYGSDSPQIREILDFSLVDNILMGQGPNFLSKVRDVTPGVDPAVWMEIEHVVEEEFSPARMRDDVAAVMYDESLPVVLDEVLSLLGSGSIARVAEIQSGYEPPETFRDYVATLESAPPPRERVELIARFAEAQGAGDFYLLIDESSRQIAHALGTVVSDQAGEYEPLVEATYLQKMQEGFQFAVLSFLHRYRPVDDALVEGATLEYETEAGRWYVETYTNAIAESVRRAGLRTVSRLSS